METGGADWSDLGSASPHWTTHPRLPRRQVVHFSLNAIHTAQTQSVAQCGGFERCSDSFLEEVRCMGGGGGWRSFSVSVEATKHYGLRI